MSEHEWDEGYLYGGGQGWDRSRWVQRCKNCNYAKETKITKKQYDDLEKRIPFRAGVGGVGFDGSEGEAAEMCPGSTWQDAQKEELSFWGDCADTYGEETKQLVYMRKMGFRPTPTWRSPVSFDGMGKSYIDIGGGPCSVLLKFVNAGLRAVVDPCQYPKWVDDRYKSCGIDARRMPGEELPPFGNMDVAFIYNVLQHVSDPELVIKNARGVAKELHVFEWIDLPPHPGHLHMLTAQDLERWTGLKGTVEYLNEGGCVGKAWYC